MLSRLGTTAYAQGKEPSSHLMSAGSQPEPLPPLPREKNHEEPRSSFSSPEAVLVLDCKRPASSHCSSALVFTSVLSADQT